MQIEQKNFNDRDPHNARGAFIPWANSVFSPGDLFLTVNLAGIENPEKYVKSKILAIEKRVYLRSSGKIVILPVLVFENNISHLHALIKAVPYQSSRGNPPVFRGR